MFGSDVDVYKNIYLRVRRMVKFFRHFMGRKGMTMTTMASTLCIYICSVLPPIV